MMESNTLSGINPQIDEALADTYGCIIYQEQVMKLVQVVFNMSLGEADMVRRAIGKKDPVLMEQMIKQMKSRKRLDGITDEQVEHILDTISKCSSYLFNKSHSAAYAYTAYQTAYLKTHYPLQFYCSLLNSNIDQDKTSEYISEILRGGYKILYPDIIHSDLGWTIEGKNLRMGFSVIRGVGKVRFTKPQDNSEEGFIDFMELNPNLNKQVSINLVKAGCFMVSPQWAIDYIEWFKISFLRKREIVSKLEKFKDNEKKTKEWKEKLKQIPESPKEYDTPIEVCRRMQIEVLGMSGINLFSLYDKSICSNNPKIKIAMIDDVQMFVSKKGNPTVIVMATTLIGRAKFIMAKKSVDLQKYRWLSKGTMVYIKTTFTTLDKGERIYFFNEITKAKEL
jgi:DNA polymerase III alpha subunit